ncbi:MAG TPA: GNAT family N-acetyltransferase [Ilumatobacteraceae bacterium]|nr:GNAT family N-acetyltransferase [Ilumatobacteraceae bacterium]HRB02917.1 GNAT family N-acetyltransferase [Ilumatobacteraceae bacterium]
MIETEIVELSPEQTHPLRLAVLRADTPTKEVVFPEDTWPGALHLGVLHNGEVVATSSWIPREHAGRPAIQLRGMATAHAVQGTGVGGLLLAAGCARYQAAGETTVWARARDAALTFYRRHGFEVEGDGFIDQTTQLPHHLVVRTL